MLTKELSPEDASLAGRATVKAGNNGSGAFEAAVGLGREPADAISLAVEVAKNHSDLSARIGDAAAAIAIIRGEVEAGADN